MFREDLKILAEQIQIELDEIQLERFEIFYKLVVEWNQKINLTAIIEPREFIIKHLIDSLTVWDDEKNFLTCEK